MENEILEKIDGFIKKYEDDYKLFVSSRLPHNHAQYRGVICVIVNIKNGLSILKEILCLAPLLTFKGSSVDANDERGVEIMEFEMTFSYFDNDWILNDE